MTKKRLLTTQQLALAAMLTALAIFIPLIMPIRIIIGPASYTLASHLPLFLAMFISPTVGAIASIGATIGFFTAGFPIIIVMRAASHLLFILIGAHYLKRSPHILHKRATRYTFSVFLNSIHALGEILVVYILSVQSNLSIDYLYMLGGLIGLGTLVHGMIDFELSYTISSILSKRIHYSLFH